MLSGKSKDKYKENINKLKEDKVELKKYNKKSRLNKRVKFVLNNLSHYKFRERLLHKAEEYGSDVKIVTEEYTSQTCGLCGELCKPNGRVYKCEGCKVEINRDINGARNILIKNIDLVLEKQGVKPEGKRLSHKECNFGLILSDIRSLEEAIYRGNGYIDNTYQCISNHIKTYI